MKKTAARSRPTTANGTALQVEFSSGVQRHIRQHARSSMSAEICGVLIGETRNGIVAVEHAIPGEGAREAGTHVTFTQETWAHVYRVKDEQYPEKRIVGWYHSHPGFGVFLSEHDLFIHTNFFPGQDQVAWVYDPHSDEEGCFVWRAGSIQALDHLGIRRDESNGGREPIAQEDASAGERSVAASASSGMTGPAPPKSPARWTVLTISHIVVLLLGFVIGSLLAPPVVLVPSGSIQHSQSPELKPK